MENKIKNHLKLLETRIKRIEELIYKTRNEQKDKHKDIDNKFKIIDTLYKQNNNLREELLTQSIEIKKLRDNLTSNIFK
jgi:septal ring factor EnvC (AmiA/AmiB activator)